MAKEKEEKLKDIKKEETKDTKKEETKKDNKKIKIIIALIIAAVLIALTPFGINWYKESKSEVKVSIQKLEDELDTLEKEKHEVFMDEGFSDSYYDLAEEIDKVSTELASKQAGLVIKYNILPIIIIGIIVAIAIAITIGKIIAKSFDSIPKTNNVIQNHHRIQMGQHKVVLDIIDRRLDEESKKETKLKPLKCPSCKANISHEATKCEYCGTSVVKVKK
jgi:H+/gluconate symporter-like permease